jgi:hypothetical protein
VPGKNAVCTSMCTAEKQVNKFYELLNNTQINSWVGVNCQSQQNWVLDSKCLCLCGVDVGWVGSGV